MGHNKTPAAMPEITLASRGMVDGPSGPKPTKRLSRRNIMIYGILIVVSLYYLVPLYVMIVTSLKGMPEIRLGNIFAPPVEITFEPWVKAWAEACTGLNCDGLSRGFWNSVRITIPSVILSIAIASVNGYALANWRFKGADIFFTILIFGAFIPYQVMLYPIVIMLREIGLYGTLWGLVIVHTIFGMPILTLLFRNYFTSLPEELFKAARVDGAGFWGIYFRIMLPMSLPILFASFIFSINGTIKVFDSVFALTGGGPGNSTTPLTLYMYRTAFQFSDFGYGSTIALLLTIMCLILTLAIFRSSRRDNTV